MKKNKKESERFVDNGDNTILDMKSGLMWAKEGSAERLNFDKAQEYCKNFTIGKFNDWRLPTREELFLLTDPTKFNPAIDPFFKCESSWYWTNTIYADGSGYAWMVGFLDGGVNWYNRSSTDYVRPVRQYLKSDNSVINKGK